MSLSYTTQDRKWLARAFVDNVGDTEYLVQTFDLSGLNVFGLTEQYYGRPQWWGVSLQYSFGGDRATSWLTGANHPMADRDYHSDCGNFRWPRPEQVQFRPGRGRPLGHREPWKTGAAVGRR